MSFLYESNCQPFRLARNLSVLLGKDPRRAELAGMTNIGTYVRFDVTL